MEREADALKGKPAYGPAMLFRVSQTAAFAGHFVKARELASRGIDTSKRPGEKQLVAAFETTRALREALVGNRGLARQDAHKLLAFPEDDGLRATAAVALALAGNSAQAILIAADLDKRHPRGTVVQFEYLPMVRAAVILGSRNASRNAEKAISALSTAVPFEMGEQASLLPAYLRGGAYLAAGQGVSAAAEFQKIIDHPGVVTNDPIGALAPLGLATSPLKIRKGGTDASVESGGRSRAWVGRRGKRIRNQFRCGVAAGAGGGHRCDGIFTESDGAQPSGSRYE